jgi:hypothetical protein
MINDMFTAILGTTSVVEPMQSFENRHEEDAVQGCEPVYLFHRKERQPSGRGGAAKERKSVFENGA